MRWRSAAALVTIALGIACGDDAGSVDGGEGECGVRATHRYGGQAPSCDVGLDCAGHEYRLSCAPSGTCTCSEDDVETSTVPYEDRFCAPTFQEGADNAKKYVDVAGEVCGWPI